MGIAWRPEIRSVCFCHSTCFVKLLLPSVPFAFSILIALVSSPDLTAHFARMDPVAIYGFTLAGAFLTLLFRRVLIWGQRLLKQLQRLCDKHLHFPFALSRRR